MNKTLVNDLLNIFETYGEDCFFCEPDRVSETSKEGEILWCDLRECAAQYNEKNMPGFGNLEIEQAWSLFMADYPTYLKKRTAFIEEVNKLKDDEYLFVSTQQNYFTEYSFFVESGEIYAEILSPMGVTIADYISELGKFNLAHLKKMETVLDSYIVWKKWQKDSNSK